MHTEMTPGHLDGREAPGHLDGHTTPSPDELLDEATWIAYRDRALVDAPPLAITELVTTPDTRQEFVTGATLLRLWDRGKRAGDGGSGPTPIQLLIADVLNAGRTLNGVLEPRRTSKTTALQIVALGRVAHRPDYRVGWTMATTGAKAGELFRSEVVAHLERRHPDPKAAPFVVNKGKGSEHVMFRDTFATYAVYAPNGDGFRGGGFDMTVIDEGGEADADLSVDLLAAALPTLDTKPDAQIVVAGTAAKYRDGNILWDTLEDPEAAVIRHAIPDHIDPEELEAWEPDEAHPKARMKELMLAAHPGIGWTTPLAAVERNYRKLPRENFLAEYGGMFGREGKSTTLIPQPHIERAVTHDRMPEPPKTFSLAFAAHPDGLWCSIGVAFVYEPPADLVQTAQALDGLDADDRKRIAVALLHHQQSTKGVARELLKFARRYRVPVIYDAASQAASVEIETLSRANPRPDLIPATTRDVREGATKTVKGFADEQIVMFHEQRALIGALEIAIKRNIGQAGGFGFGRPRDNPAADITPVEAISLALQYLDPDAQAPHETTPDAAIMFA